MRTILLTGCCLLFTLPDYAYAYLDPGTGSFMLQLIIGGLVSTLFTIKIFWRRIIGLLTGMLRRKKKNEEEH